MILILSEKTDITSTKVSEWLYHYSVPYLRIDESLAFDIINFVSIQNNSSEITFTYKEKQYSFNDFSIVWNRRGLFDFTVPSNNFIKEKTGIDNHSLRNNLIKEKLVLRNYIAHKLAQKFHIDDSRQYSANKLIVLETARAVGLKIPETYITNDFTNLNKIKTSLITKNISEVLIDFSYNYLYKKQGTLKLDKELLSENQFFYSLFQNEITKKYEIRTFVFFNKLFSMAIFSQNNEKTHVDFRNYDKEKGNRMVPYILPDNIEKKIIKLMSKLNLQSGSIDLIFDGFDYVFLEVNPVGQLDFVSGNCNYQIEKYIANFLKNKYNELKKVN